MVEVNCSTLPDTLAESELFGHERGAFTDARAARMGLFEAANGGALFLDELPSLSPAMQAKVLTAIEDRKIRRLGGTRELAVDVRIIAATNRDLKQLVAEGKFRQDLFHRLDLFRLQLPPLRERGDDILKLAETLLTRLRERHHLPRKAISESGKKRLLAHPWPGNVRELAHEIERAIVFSDGDTLDFEHLEAERVVPFALPRNKGRLVQSGLYLPAAGVFTRRRHQSVDRTRAQTNRTKCLRRRAVAGRFARLFEISVVWKTVRQDWGLTPRTP